MLKFKKEILYSFNFLKYTYILSKYFYNVITVLLFKILKSIYTRLS
jgi:hypothetical protein